MREYILVLIVATQSIRSICVAQWGKDVKSSQSTFSLSTVYLSIPITLKSIVRWEAYLLSSQIRSHEAAISINCTASMQMRSPGQVHGAYAGINAGFTLSPEIVV